MPVQRFVPEDLLGLYAVHDWRNGLAVLKHANPEEWDDILAVLRVFRLHHTEIATPGGGKSLIANRLDGGFKSRGWTAKRFDTRITVDDVEHPSPTHEVDMFKGRVALEVEWNNKDPFYDRDLNNFRLLFDLRVIDVGVIVTRATELQGLFVEVGRDKQSYGASTTHLDSSCPAWKAAGVADARWSSSPSSAPPTSMTAPRPSQKEPPDADRDRGRGGHLAGALRAGAQVHDHPGRPAVAV